MYVMINNKNCIYSLSIVIIYICKYIFYKKKKKKEFCGEDQIDEYISNFPQGVLRCHGPQGIEKS